HLDRAVRRAAGQPGGGRAARRHRAGPDRLRARLLRRLPLRHRRDRRPRLGRTDRGHRARLGLGAHRRPLGLPGLSPGMAYSSHSTEQGKAVMDPEKIRASDADRERVADRLREALAEGRLDQSEHEERLDELYRAKTIGELAEVTRDLPAPGAGEPGP